MVSVDSFRPRLWPIVAMLAIAAVCVFVLPALFTRTSAHFFGMLGGPVMCSLGVVAWWLRGLKGQGKYRWLPFVVFLLPSFVLAATVYRGDPKFVFAFGFPFIGLLWIVWLLVSIPFPWRLRRVGVIATILLGWSLFSLIRIDQTSAELKPELSWRWIPTSEEQYIAELATRKPSVSAVATETANVKPGDWAEFRGPKRDNRIEGVTFDTNWATNPPKLFPRTIGLTIPSASQSRTMSSAHVSRFHSSLVRQSLRPCPRWSYITTCATSRKSTRPSL